MTLSINDRYTAETGYVQMTGVQALVRLPFNVRRADRTAGRETAVFISGYEGSPLGGYDLELHRSGELLGAYDVVFQPGVNEELAATSVQGTQLVPGSGDARVAGVTGFWYGKSPGLDRASDALRHANLAGTHPDGGAVAFVGDDPAAKSSTVPGSSEALLADLGMPVLCPADPQEVLDLGMHAVAMSRHSGLWVALKVVTNVADGTGKVQVDSDRVTTVKPDVPAVGAPFRHAPNAHMMQPHLADLEKSREGVRLTAAQAYVQANRLNRVESLGGTATVGLVAAGKTYLDLRQALDRLGIGEGLAGVRLLRLAAIHPLVPTEVRDFAAGLEEIVVVEEKRGFIESALKQLLYGVPDAPRIVGKSMPDGTALFPADGELDSDLITAGLVRALSGRPGFELDGGGSRRQSLAPLPLVSRTPYFCSGCPHSTSRKVPDGTLVGAGIGCHALVLMMGVDQVGDVLGLTQMGGEGAQWIGMAPFLRTRRRLVQNIGDGTFHHSGSLAVRAAVAAGVNITYKLLYNSAVAMTGGQHAEGAMSIPALTSMLTAEGVRRIVVTTDDPTRYRDARLAPTAEVWPRDRIVEAQRMLADVPGVTVLIHDQECATELRRKRKRGRAPDPVRRIVINTRMCEGCGDCGERSNCLSVQPIDTEFGRKTAIDQSSCNKHYSCLVGDCPSFLSVVPSADMSVRPQLSDITGEAIPEPRTGHDLRSGTHTTRITGVGGSGVVTLSQILTAAAMSCGLEVRTLDQTGLAQKGGAVVSDVRISASAIEQSNKAAAGECDLYLGCDLLVAGDAKHLAVVDPLRTVAVVSTAKVPTGHMVVDPTTAFPDVDAIAARIRSATRSEDAIFVDARRLSLALFGTDQFANMFLAGVALQRGALPLPASAVERAIQMNGIQVAGNLQAFRRGRQYVSAPRAFSAALKEISPEVAGPRPTRDTRRLVDLIAAPAGSELERLVTRRVVDLADYQSLAYARRYAFFVAHVRHAEESAGLPSELSEAAAHYLYKLMAYKDEYEVARLALEPATELAFRAEFGAAAKVSYLLHPPLLRALGLKRKLRLGPWFRPVLRCLRSLKFLRGTPFDPFGYTRIRRVERSLINEYCALVSQLLVTLDAGTYRRCVELASLPDTIRGYEAIKLASIDRYRRRVAELSARVEVRGRAAKR